MKDCFKLNDFINPDDEEYSVKKRISKESVNKELRRITVLLRLYKEIKSIMSFF